MADQTVRIEGDSGSPQAVAFKLWVAISSRHSLKTSAHQDLELFAECLSAARSQSFDAKKFTSK